MSSLRKAKAVFASIVVLGSLSVVASASAAAWQGPIRISALGVNAGSSLNPPQLALGTRGDEAAGWWDPSGIILSRKLVGQPQSAPIIVAPSAPTSIYPGVDGAGNVTAAWSVGGTTTIASWPANAATATTAPLLAALTINDLAVNSAGVVVLAGTNGANVVVGYRPAGGTFAFHTFTVGGGSYLRPRVAINAAGMAVVIFRDNVTGLWSSTRTATADWIAAPEPVRSNAVADPNSINPSVTIDSAGNAFAAYAYTPSPGIATVRTGLRPPTGGWQESGDLSSTTAGFTADYVTVAVNPSGAAILVWKQTSTTNFANIQARYGSTGTGIWGPIETVNDAGADVPVAAIGNDGMAVVAWERELGIGTGNIGQARVRSPGATGTFGDIHNLSGVHDNYTKPSIGTDGRGDFAIVSAPYDGTAQHAILSVYDASPPTLATPTVTGTLLAGDSATFAVTATDEWSSVGVPAWTFGDGGTGSGASVAHIYAAAGTYTAHVTVSDGSGNSTAKDIAVTVASPQSTLTSAKFSAKWKVSRVSGTLNVAGTAPRAGTYAIDVFKGNTRKIHVSYTLAAGAFTRAIKLPAKLVPGTYGVSLVPADAQVKGATLDAKLAAPPEGVVDVAFLSGARNGTAARTLTGATTIWASFHFAAKPKGKLTLTWYRLGKKRVRIGSTSKDVATKVVSYLRIGRTFVGTYQAVLSRKGVVIARVSVKAKKA